MASSSVVINLLDDDDDAVTATAPRRWTGAFHGHGETLDLCTSDEEDVAPKPPPLAKRKASELNNSASAGLSSNALGKRPAVADQGGKPAADAATVDPHNNDDDGEGDDEDLCVEVEPQKAAPVPAQAPSDSDRDEDIQFVGRTGMNALADFPHGRENCLESPWKPGSEAKACPNCYCYVCDNVASSCPEWASSHCFATHTVDKWRRMRAAWKAAGGKPSAAVAAAKSGAASSSSSSSSSGSTARFGFSRPGSLAPAPSSPPSPVERRYLSREERQRWPAERFLKAIEQVYPIEMPEPAGFAFTLRPYQRQSLAYMVQVEKSNDPKLAGRLSSGRTVRGGFLADEMGMGKTAVCCALILAARNYTGGLTVVLVNNTLVGQWMDEITKFAPTLNVVKHYGSHPPIQKTTDVVITTPHTKPCEQVLAKCRRLILDESHLYEPKADPKLPQGRVFKYAASYIWCVTGTPFSTSLNGMATQASFLGHWGGGLNLSTLAFAPTPTHDPPHSYDSLSKTNEAIVDVLQSLIIRHSKSQRISGEVALALPDSDVETVWLEMSRDERVLYDLHGCADGVPKWADENRMTELTIADVRDGLGKRRAALAGLWNEDAVTGTNRSKGYFFTLANPDQGKLRKHGCDAFRWLCYSSEHYDRRASSLTKYAALLADLKQLVAREAEGVSVVIFTHHNEVLHELSRVLEQQRYTVFEISRSTEPAKRHAALRKFQGGASQPGCRVFATTFGTAAVGLTLTAASRVYLLESSLDPAQEAQAAGRIHRLGQTKEVLVKKFLFKSSLDEAIDALHKKIKAGGVTLDGGRFPPEALALFRSHGVAQPHTADPRAPQVEALRRFRSNNKRNVKIYGGIGGFDYGKKVLTQACTHCGRPVEVAGTSVWWGKGCWASLEGCTDDYPALLQGVAGVPEQQE